MMDTNFPACLSIILASEGGFTESLGDGSIATNLGVTLRTWSAWIGRTATIAEIEALTPEAVTPLYRADYWGVVHCPELPSGVDLFVFDMAVNQGPGTAIRCLQRAAHTTVDGFFGSATALAVRLETPELLIVAMAADRERLYRASPDFARFGTGWLARTERTKAAALAMVKR